MLNGTFNIGIERNFGKAVFSKGTSWNLEDWQVTWQEKPTWAAKARPAVFKIDHPGTAVKMPVSLTRSVQRKHIKSEGDYRDGTYTVWKGQLYTYRGRWPFSSKPTNAFCLSLPLIALNSSSPKVSFQLCFWVEIPDELTQNMAFKPLTGGQKP